MNEYKVVNKTFVKSKNKNSLIMNSPLSAGQRGNC